MDDERPQPFLVAQPFEPLRDVVELDSRRDERVQIKEPTPLQLEPTIEVDLGTKVSPKATDETALAHNKVERVNLHASTCRSCTNEHHRSTLASDSKGEVERVRPPHTLEDVIESVRRDRT